MKSSIYGFNVVFYIFNERYIKNMVTNLRANIISENAGVSSMTDGLVESAGIFLSIEVYL